MSSLKSIQTVMAIVVVYASSAVAQKSTVTFDNKSGEPALVKVIGPKSQTLEVPTAQKRTVNAVAGDYHILLRYGVKGRYRYAKGDHFEVKETPKTSSAITITLHEVLGGNYRTTPISEKDFEAGGNVPEDRNGKERGKLVFKDAKGHTITLATTSVSSKCTPTFHKLSPAQAGKYPSGKEYAGTALTGNIFDNESGTLLCSDGEMKKLRETASALDFTQASDRARLLNEFIQIFGAERAAKIGVRIHDQEGRAKYVWPHPKSKGLNAEPSHKPEKK